VNERLAAALADRYRLERELGAGGMATVYLAHDVRHDRKVAIKVLKPELAAVLGAERFVQEIRTTAQLQHPHILPLFDSGDADGFLYYVMPYVEGETIREKLNRETQFGIDEAVKIATEVADALEYAHQHGVIHRDIKPENILLHAGRPMVMDFGIALAVSAAAGGRMTETGLSLGTPHYMSPEQATADKAITARSDVYSLASVLYEMLAGEPPHMGNSAQQIIMKIVTEEPAPVTQRRKTVPTHVSDALTMALEKLPADRFPSARAFADALANPAFAIGGVGRSAGAGTYAPWHRYAGVMITGLALVAVVTTALALRRGRGAPPADVMRVALALPPSAEVSSAVGTHLTWAPDGRSFVYVGPGGNGTQLWRRSLDALESTPIRGTDGATSPFFSPDGTRLGYIVLNPFSLWVVPSSGGTPQLVVQDSVSGGGGAWSEDGYIYFDGLSSLARVRPDGSGREAVYRLDTARGEVGVGWPEVLPKGKGVLFRLRSAGEDVGDYRLMVADGRSGTAKMLLRAPYARYAPSGHLLYVTADGSLMATRLDLDRLEQEGTAVPLARGLFLGAFGSADVALSASGTLLYASGTEASNAVPTWVSREGVATTVDPAWPKGNILSLTLSPEGSRLAVVMTSATANSSPEIWVKQLDRGALSRLTFGATRNRFPGPSWSVDGRDLFYASDTSGTSALYRQRADGSQPSRLVVRGARGMGPAIESPDGRWLVLESGVCCDILGFRPGVDSVPVPLLDTPAQERTPALSADGRWLAYVSDETGTNEVYVRPFPDVQSGKWQVSTGRGLAPQWSHRGTELFYLDSSLAVVAVRVTGRPSFEIAGQQRLFSAAGYAASGSEQAYAVAPDDRRFLMLRASSPSGEGARSLVLVQGFQSELERQLP